MSFHSILFEKSENHKAREIPQAPAVFGDLNLDQVVDAITISKAGYNLKPFFYRPLNDVDAIHYRHEIMQDLENAMLYEDIKSFAQKMRSMREHLAQANKLRYKYQKERWFLDAVEIYCAAVDSLSNDLVLVEVKSRGLLALCEYLTHYVKSDSFASLVVDTKRLKVDLSSVKYSLLVKGSCITVLKYEGENDYSADVEATFEKFQRGAVKDYLVTLRTWPDMNHVEEQILDRVARLYPDIFLNLDTYCVKNTDYLDKTIGAFDREVQFYVSYLEFIARFKRAGLSFCYPDVSDKDKEVYDLDGFDLALANKLIGEESPIICNDFYLEGKERIFVVTGPNQGGKTTFARTFGQLHYLASLGCPVPGKEARLFLFNTLFTHFEKEENIQNLRGKLQDDLVRIHAILSQATPNSIIIMNEIFTSTTLEDALFLSKRVMDRIIELDLLCVCVTFIDELASLSEKTVSVASTIVPENPVLRTYKIVRKPADGLAYALSIAEKHHITYASLKERIKS